MVAGRWARHLGCRRCAWPTHHVPHSGVESPPRPRIFRAMPPTDCVIDGRTLAVADVVRIARNPSVRVAVDPGARDALLASRQRVEAAIATGQTIYGVNTGFGKLANVRVAADKLDQLQINLIRSHAAGVGDPLPAAVVRALMLLRANVLLRPTSGVRPELVDALIGLLNAGIVPLVPEQG